MAELLSNPNFRITTSAAEDPSVMRIEIFATSPRGSEIARYLIEQSQKDSDPEEQLPYTFAGQHVGMPLHTTWAITRDGSPIDPYLDTVAGDVANAIGTLRPKK